MGIPIHDYVIKWKHFPRYWPFVRGIHRSPVNSPHKGQWRGALIFSLICARINGWVNKRPAGDLTRHLAHYDVIVMTGNKASFFIETATWICLSLAKDLHWNWTIILMTFSSMAAQKVVILTIFVSCLVTKFSPKRRHLCLSVGSISTL